MTEDPGRGFIRMDIKSTSPSHQSLFASKAPQPLGLNGFPISYCFVIRFASHSLISTQLAICSIDRLGNLLDGKLTLGPKWTGNATVQSLNPGPSGRHDGRSARDEVPGCETCLVLKGNVSVRSLHGGIYGQGARLDFPLPFDTVVLASLMLSALFASLETTAPGLGARVGQSDTSP